MISHSFEARIVNGQIIPAQALKPFEGQQVQVTVSAPEKCAPVRATDEAENGPEPAEDLDVEKDVYVPMPFPSEAVAKPILTTETSLKPCLILPKDLPDE